MLLVNSLTTAQKDPKDVLNLKVAFMDPTTGRFKPFKKS
jgi:hypothetical protein